MLGERTALFSQSDTLSVCQSICALCFAVVGLADTYVEGGALERGCVGERMKPSLVDGKWP